MGVEESERKERRVQSQETQNATVYLCVGVTFFVLGLTMSLYAFTGVAIAFLVLSFVEYNKETKKPKLGESDPEKGVDDNPDTQS